jgi:hypothetical protein
MYVLIAAARVEINTVTHAAGLATGIKHVGRSFHKHTPRYVVLQIVITCVKVKVNLILEQTLKAQRGEGGW